MPAAVVTVRLVSPLIVGDETITAIPLRAPTLEDINELGDPVDVAKRGDVFFVSRNWPVLAAYIERLGPAGAAAWRDELSVGDALAIANEIIRRCQATLTAAEATGIVR